MDSEASNFIAESGSAIKPQYAQRSMKCYAVTESELKQIGLANIFTTASFGVGSALLALWLDIFKDVHLTEAVPDDFSLLIGVTQPLLFLFGVIFWIIAAIVWNWRRNMINLIKKESD